MKILVWGCGNMASAFVQGLARAHKDLEFICWNPSAEKAQALAAKVNGRVLADAQVLPTVDAVILGFKPQKLAEAAPALAKLPAGATVISLLAAVDVARLQTFFSTASVIRVMPNLAVAQGQGVVLWHGVSAAWAKYFQSLGLAPQVSEQLMDVYTLHAGCSPAFLFAWIDEAAKFAVKNGGEAELARKILIKAWQGALVGLENDSASMAEKITAVASRGGVTRAALDGFAQCAPDYIEQGFAAGLKRIQELKS
jgi:pyrroline-5-carboxylate reductase